MTYFRVIGTQIKNQDDTSVRHPMPICKVRKMFPNYELFGITENRKIIRQRCN